MRRRARAARSTPAMRLRASAPPAVAIALVIAAVFLPRAEDPARPPHPVPVSRTAFACPAGSSIATGQVIPPASIRAIEIPGGRHVLALEAGDRWRRFKASRTVVVDEVGRGAGAAGFFSRLASTKDGGGLMVGSCPATVDESWFLGLGSGAKHESRLELTNVSDAVAVADVSLWGTEGAISAVGATGVVVQPRTTRSIDVGDLASGEPELAVRVVRRRGAFAVSAFDGSRRVFSGSEAVPSTSAPHRDQIISGLPAKVESRTLVITNTSTATSRVAVEVIGKKGPFSPRGLDAIRAPAGRVTLMDLPGGVGSDGLALHLTSERPIAAVARIGSGKSDYAVAVAARRLDGPAIVPVDLGGGIGRPRLTITAPHSAASVQMTGYDASMKPLRSQTFRIRGETTTTLKISDVSDSERLAYVVVRAKGEIMGAARFTKDELIASIPLEAAPVSVLGPDVQLIN